MKKSLFSLFLLIWLFWFVSASCYTDFGIYATDNYNWTCSCMKWYHFENKYWLWTQCVQDPTCYDLYGIWAKDNYNWTCSCRDWYTWWVDVLWNKKCIDADQSCRDDFWRWAESAWWWMCKCSSSYTWSTDIFWDKQCVTCTTKYWLHSSYDYLLSSCTCDKWYTLWKDGQCVEKQNNVYFLLKDLDTDNNQIIIYANYKTYLVDYWLGCLSIWKYENKLLVVNLWTDFTLDRRDTIVLPNDDQTCSITSKELVDDSYTLKSCIDIYWDNSVEVWNNKCSCDVGYIWNNNKTQCIEWVSNVVANKYNTVSYNTSNIDNVELTDAIKWMYDNKLTSYNTVDTFMWDDYITREQASKFFVMFADTFWQRPDSIKENTFTDVKNANPNLYPFICVAYSLWIMNWNNNRFMPFDNLTPAQSLAMLIRITDWKLNEQWANRYTEYYNHANADWILDGLGLTLSNLDITNIKRKDMALLLYRARQ